jgi:hypothetical protein
VRQGVSVTSFQNVRVDAALEVGPDTERDEIAFIATQFIAGETVAERLRTGSLPMVEALRIAGNMAGALGEAHRLTGCIAMSSQQMS